MSWFFVWSFSYRNSQHLWKTPRGSRFGAAGAAERAAAGATAPFGGAAAAPEGRGRAEELQGAKDSAKGLDSWIAGGWYWLILVIYSKIITYCNILQHIITYYNILFFLIYMIITYYNYKNMWVSEMKDNGDAMNTSFRVPPGAGFVVGSHRHVVLS